MEMAYMKLKKPWIRSRILILGLLVTLIGMTTALGAESDLSIVKKVSNTTQLAPPSAANFDSLISTAEARDPRNADGARNIRQMR
jgi:hypothetical protein